MIIYLKYDLSFSYQLDLSECEGAGSMNYYYLRPDFKKSTENEDENKDEA